MTFSVLIVLAGLGLVYVGLLSLGMGMYFLNGMMTDQPCWEFKGMQDELFFYFVTIPFLVGPVLTVLELVCFGISIILAAGPVITNRGSKAA